MWHIIKNNSDNTRRFESEEVSKDIEDATVEEIVMEGNPKAPKFHMEKHIEPPRDVYVEQA